MVLDDHFEATSDRIGELDIISKQIANNITLETRKLSDSIGQIVNLLENFKFQILKLHKLRYCDHELAYVTFRVSIRLFSQIKKQQNESAKQLLDQLLSTIDHQKSNYDAVKEIIIRAPHQADSLLQRFATLQAGPSKVSNQRWIDYQLSDSIAAHQLNDLMRNSPQDILLLDFRSRKEFAYSHINFLNVVNIEPLLVKKVIESRAGPTDMDLEVALSERSEKSSLHLFQKRFKFELVVIYNLRFGGISDDRFDSLEYSLLHGDGNGLPSQNPFRQLIDLLIFRNQYISSRLKRYPVYIRGGLEKWHQIFGESALTNHSSNSLVDDSSVGPNRGTSTIAENSYLRNFTDYLASAKSSMESGLSQTSKRIENYDPALSQRLFSTRPSSNGSKSLIKTDLRKQLNADGEPVRVADSDILKVGELPVPQSTKTDSVIDFYDLFTTGLTNLGNSCYMNCILQCLSSTPQLTKFFFPVGDSDRGQSLQSYKEHINMKNQMGSKGKITVSFVKLLANMFNSSGKYFTPNSFKQTVGALSPGRQFASFDQQDCIEFLNFILDGLHEDLNQRVVENAEERAKIMDLTPEQEKAREYLPIRLASTIEWERYLKLNFSVIVDYFQGQYLSQLRCLECNMTSTTYNSFSILSLPLPERLAKNLDKISLSQCLNAFTEIELLDDDNKWHCPRCQKFTKLTKKLTITRLPRVLILHLKRFNLGPNGYFKKLETFVTYPVNEVLDLTSFWPPVGTFINDFPEALMSKEKEQSILRSFPDRFQDPPFRYRLFGVVNHFGNLSTGHYTSYVKKGRGSGVEKGWCYFDDAKVQFQCKESQVLNKNAYCLFYRRI